MRTLLLDDLTWDLTVGVDGNVAVASDPYAQAQDAASAIKLFAGELYYDTSQGIPYWQQILGHLPPQPLIQKTFDAAALTVPGVASAASVTTLSANRIEGGTVTITNTDGLTAAAAF